MRKELDSAFVDVRNAFRLLSRYQARVLDIIGYIREQTPFTDMWGLRRFCNTIGTKRNSPDKDYANLRVYSDMWGWDFLYGYLFEYYFGAVKIQLKTIEMSIIQVSDDGFFKSTSLHPSRTNIESFDGAEDSDSWLVFVLGYNAWLRDDVTDDYDAFLHKFLAGNDDCVIYKGEKGEWAITKKYPMQRFASQPEADKVLSDFNKIIKETAGIELFKK